MDEEDVKCLPWHEMGLDDRILKAIAKLGWAEPTPIQERAVPLALEGKDILARGRTGSGKTGAFAIPLINRILMSKSSCASGKRQIRAMLMAPSRELAKQISAQLESLMDGCKRTLTCLDLSPQVDLAAQEPMLRDMPDIIVGTPSRILAHLKEGHMELKDSLEMLVIDEADLIFSFGYGEDVEGILRRLPNTYQSILTSATLNEDIDKLRNLGVLRNPVTLKLEEPQLPPSAQLTQYQIKIEEEDKFVLIYALFKLKLVQGKSIIFVNSVDRCYKIKLYLEQFQIPVCVLNSELPVATRCHIVGQFNQGIYDIIVASDERFLDEDFGDAEPKNKKRWNKKEKKVDRDKERSKREKDKESGVARGIDFQFVSNVINFDFPSSADSYVHRVGRTARGNNKGAALSLVAGREMDKLAEVETALKQQMGVGCDDDDDETDESDSVLKPYRFKMEELDGFRYRARDAWRSVTKIAVREARLKEIRQELLNSTRLRAHFEDNPRDAIALRHDKALHTVKVQPHLKGVPDYIIPQALKKASIQSRRGRIRAKQQQLQQNKDKRGGPMSQAKKKFQKRKADPLKNLK